MIHSVLIDFNDDWNVWFLLIDIRCQWESPSCTRHQRLSTEKESRTGNDGSGFAIGQCKSAAIRGRNVFPPSVLLVQHDIYFNQSNSAGKWYSVTFYFVQIAISNLFFNRWQSVSIIFIILLLVPFLMIISFAVIICQVAVGVGLILNSRYNVKNKEQICRADRINNFTIIGIFLITTVNVFITAFGVAPSESKPN